MNPWVLNLYHRLPAPLQNLLSSRHGARLMRLRYGETFCRELPHFVERETWSAQQWQQWQSDRLRALLRRAVERVPYYRDLHAHGEFPIEGVTPDDLTQLPLLEKDPLRRAPEDFLADDCNPAQMYAERTSGTTGKPLMLWWSPETHQTWYACFERRVRNWSGVKLGDRWATLGGQLVVPQHRQRPPFWVWNASGSQLYMSSYHLRSDFLDAYLDELKRREIEYIFGYASSLDALATHALERGRTDIQFKVAISNAEPFYAHQRRRIEKAFSCPTRDTYAPAELTIAAFECEAGRMHLSPDVGITEVVDDEDHLLPPGETGHLVVTSLLNPDHILIRYRQGDRGALAAGEDSCPCGRTMPVLESIEGRADDVLITGDGRKIGRLDPIFKDTIRIREAQIIQEAIDRVVVKVVAAEGYDENDVAAIRKGICDRMGPMNVSVVVVDCLPRTSAGKLRAVINQVQHPAESAV